MLRSRLTVEHLRKSSRLSLLSHDSQLVIGLVREYRSSLQGVAFSRQTEPRSSGDLACCCCSGRPRKGGGSARLGNARREKGRQRARARQRSRSFAAPRFRTDEGEDLVNINIKKKDQSGGCSSSSLGAIPASVTVHAASSIYGRTSTLPGRGGCRCRISYTPYVG
jgi:hypothetical protein